MFRQPPFSERPLQVLPPTAGHVGGWAGEVDPVVRSPEVFVGLRPAVRSVEYTRRVSPTVRRAVRPATLTGRERWPGFQSTFPGVCAGTARNWPSGSLALALSNLTRPSVVGCGLPNLGLSHHAALPSLFPGLDEVGALQYVSPVLNLHRSYSHAAYLRRT